MQDIPLTGVLHSAIGGCNTQELAIIRSKCPDGMLYESLLAFRDRKTDDRDEEELVLREKISHFIELLEEMRDLAVYTPVHELIQYILRKQDMGIM